MNGPLRKLLLAGLVSAAFGVAACREGGRLEQANERAVAPVPTDTSPMDEPGSGPFTRSQSEPGTGGSGEAGTGVGMHESNTVIHDESYGQGEGTKELPSDDGQRGAGTGGSGMAGMDGGSGRGMDAGTR